MADKTVRPRKSPLTLMKGAAGGRAAEGRKGTEKAAAAGVPPRATMLAEPPARDPKILEVRRLSDLSQPKFRLRYPQGAEEGAASALVNIEEISHGRVTGGWILISAGRTPC